MERQKRGGVNEIAKQYELELLKTRFSYGVLRNRRCCEWMRLSTQGIESLVGRIKREIRAT